MLSDGVALLRFIFTFVQMLKNRKMLKFLFWLPVFLCLIAFPVTAATNNWELTPENPVVGDIIEIKGTDFTGETAEVQVTFEKDVPVSDGRYEYLLEGVTIPDFNNRFTVKATGADDLNLRVKMLLWVTKTGEAKDGATTVSQSNVPPGTYKIKIDGKASTSNVKIKITGLQQVKVDSDGSFSYEYDSQSIPAGNFEVKVGDVEKQIKLKPGESLPSEIVPSSEQKTDPEKEETKINGTETNGTETNETKINGTETGEGKKEDLQGWKASYMPIAGILAGIVVFRFYLRTRKN